MGRQDLADHERFVTATRQCFPEHLLRAATIGQDGSIHLDDGAVHATLSGAAKAVSGNTAEAGWHFWARHDGTVLTEVRAEYLAGTDDETADDDA